MIESNPLNMPKQTSFKIHHGAYSKKNSLHIESMVT